MSELAQERRLVTSIPGPKSQLLELDLPAMARRIREIMLGRLRAIQGKYEIVGDVGGRGVMIAVERVEPDTKNPNAAATGAPAKACHAEGLVVLAAGARGNVLRFLPPLV